MTPASRASDARSPSAADEALRRRVADAGCRATPQRLAVLTHLVAVDNHPTADEVFGAVRRELPRISLATVYNALDALVAAGLARQLAGHDGVARYDGRTDDHYHIRDLATGELRDLPAEFDPGLIEQFASGLVERLAAEGFEVSGHRLEVLGRFRR